MRKIILIFNLINLSLALNLFAVDYQDEIKVEGAKFRPMNLAMPKIRADLNASFAKELERIIDLDLDESGVFAILNRKGYLSKSTEGMLKHQIKFSNWRNIGAEGLIKLEVDNQTAKIFVYNLSNLNKFFAREYQINHYSKNFTRVLAHKISDDIFKFFTGEPGVFSTKLAAIKLIENKKQLVLLSADGQVETQLTSRESYNLLPSFSGDGKKIFFTNYSRKNPDLYELDLSNGNKIKLLSGRPGLNVGGVMSPDGKKIALTLSKDGNSELYLLNTNGKIIKKLTNSWGVDTSPSFSPDGKQIAFVSTRVGNPHVYLMNSDGSAVRRLTFKGKYNQTPRFSPDGEHIAFTARDEFKTFDIFVVNAKTGQISRVTQDQGSNEDPWFSPNGRFLVFSSTRSGERDLFVSSLSGSFQKKITNGGYYWTPSWGPVE